MSQRLFPRLSPDRAEHLRRQLLSRDDPTIFDPSLLDDVMSESRAFPATGGQAISRTDLQQIRTNCLEAQRTAKTLTTKKMIMSNFDLAVGRELYIASSESTGEFGQAQVWDFLTLVLLPDLATWRFSPTSKGAAARFASGNRRHVFRRLWRRWHVFGPEIVQDGFLDEDNYASFLERRLPTEHAAVARSAFKAIRNSDYTGPRREYVRVFMRQLLQASGLVEINGDDTSHLNEVISYVDQVTQNRLRPEE
ncbi:hypothetical protein NLM24_48595 [Nocardia zapadnayensis]|nr:hypothetical protein [Nocardia zapadnayensis]MCX0278262.1 hypothetical protein [Nocardia zapadnayensis]